jgi:hypothetical protein
MFVLQVNAEVNIRKKLISVKLFEYMACEKPIVSTVVGEGAGVVDKSCAGFSIEPGDASGGSGQHNEAQIRSAPAASHGQVRPSVRRSKLFSRRMGS